MRVVLDDTVQTEPLGNWMVAKYEFNGSAPSGTRVKNCEISPQQKRPPMWGLSGTTVMRAPRSHCCVRGESGAAEAKSAAVSCRGCAESMLAMLGWNFSMASWVSLNMLHIDCLAW